VWSYLDKLVAAEDAVSLAHAQAAEVQEYDVFAMIDAHRARKPSLEFGQVASYRSLPVESVKTNALTWWQAHEAQYPSLARVARVYLGMAASSATAERVFSRGSLVLTTRRTRLGVDIFEAQVLAGCNKLFLEFLKTERLLL
jgi:hypothetical protein